MSETAVPYGFINFQSAQKSAFCTSNRASEAKYRRAIAGFSGGRKRSRNCQRSGSASLARSNRVHRCQTSGFSYGSYFHYTMKVSKGVVKKTCGFLNDPSLHTGLWLTLSPLQPLHLARRFGVLRPPGWYSALRIVFAEICFLHFQSRERSQVPQGNSEDCKQSSGFSGGRKRSRNCQRSGSAGSARAPSQCMS